MTVVEQQIDESKVEEFVGKALGDMSGLSPRLLAGIGDRLGLFRDLAENGPATSDELARPHRASTSATAGSGSAQMTAAGYLSYAPDTGRFWIPPEHVPVLAQETGAGVLRRLLRDVARA